MTLTIKMILIFNLVIMSLFKKTQNITSKIYKLNDRNLDKKNFKGQSIFQPDKKKKTSQSTKEFMH